MAPPTDEQLRAYVAEHGSEHPDMPDLQAAIKDARERGVLDIASEGDINAPIINAASDVPIFGTWAANLLKQASDNPTNPFVNTAAAFALPGDLGQGLGEAAWNIGVVPAAAGLYSGAKSWFTVPYNMYQGNSFAESMKMANQDMNELFGTMAWTPRSITGKIMMGTINSGFQIYDDGARTVADWTADTLFDPVNITLEDGSKISTDEQKEISANWKGLMNQYKEYTDNGETPPAGLISELNEARVGALALSNAEINTSAGNIGTYFTIKTLLDFAPDIASQGRTMFKRRQLVKQTENQMREMGFDPDMSSVDRIATFADQENLPGVTTEGSTQVGSGGPKSLVERGAGNQIRGQNLGDFQEMREVGNFGQREAVGLDPNNLQASLKIMDDEMIRVSEMLYQKARQSNNYAPTQGLEMGLLNTTIANTFANPDFNFRMDAAPRTRSFLNEISEMSRNPDIELQQKGDVIPNETQIGEGPFTGYTDINKLWNLRQRMNGEIRRFDIAFEKGTTPDIMNDRAGLKSLRKSIDDFLDSSFESDMFGGNPQSQQMWRDANNWYKDYINDFQGNVFINKITGKDHNFTGEGVHQMIFGMADAGHKTMAADSIRGVADVFGYDSPQMDFLRNDILFDLFEPLQRNSQQNFPQYIDRYQNYFRKNRSLMNELFTDDQIKKFEYFNDIISADLKVMAKSGENATTKIGIGQQQNIRDAAALLIVPGDTGLAMAQFRLRMARKVFDSWGKFASDNAGGTAKQRFMMEFLGLDPRATMSNMGASPMPGDPTMFQLRSQAVREQHEEGTVQGDWTLKALKELRDRTVRNNPFVGESEDLGTAVGQ